MALSPIGQKIQLPGTNANSTPPTVPKLSSIGQKIYNGNIGGAFGDESLNASNAGIAINTVLGLPKATFGVAKEIARSIPRGILSTALTFAPKSVRQNIGEINPQQDFGKVGTFALGNEPIGTISDTGRKVLASLGVENQGAMKYGAPVVGGLLTGLDLYPGAPKKAGLEEIAKAAVSIFRGGDELVESLVKSDSLKGAYDIATGAGIPDTVASKYAQRWAAGSNEAEIKQTLKEITSMRVATVPNTSKGPSGKAEFKNIDSNDLGEVVNFVDDVRLGKTPDIDNAIATRRLAERYSINPDQSDAVIANAFTKKLDTTPEVRSALVKDAITPIEVKEVETPLAQEAQKYPTAREFVAAQRESAVEVTTITPEDTQALTKIWEDANLAKLSSGDRYAQETTVEALQADLDTIFKGNAPQIPVLGVPNSTYFKNANAEGEMFKGTIKLLEKAGKVSDFVGKHETWHLLKRGMVTKEERAIIEQMEDELVKSAPNRVAKLKKAGYKDEQIAEELMADEFARYYRTGKTFSSKLKIIFDKLLQRIQMMLVNKGDILKYFDSVSQKVTGEIKGNTGSAQASINGDKKLSRIDQLIADNKIRVVSREGRDVYQIKKGGEWATVRDEDSAIKQVTQVKYRPKKGELPERLEQKLVALDIKKEALESNPARELSKYIAKSGDNKGLLGEVTGKQASKTGFGTDVRAADLGFENSEEARTAYEAYKTEKAGYLAEKKEVMEAVKQERTEAKLRTVREQQQVVEARTATPRITKAEAKSLEETAQQLVEANRYTPRETPMSLKDIVTQTPVSKKVNALDWIRTPDRVLRKIGFGKEADLVRNQYEKYVMELPKNMKIIDSWAKQVPRASSERLFKYLDGEDITLSPAETKVAGEMQAYLKQWADRLGLPEDKRIASYITHIFDDQLIAKEFDEDLAKLIADKIPGQVYDPFLEKRLGALGYKRDVWAALDAYTKRATRKVHMDVALNRIQEKAGSSLEFSNLEKSQWEYLSHYVDRVNMRPTKIDEAVDNSVKAFIGYKFGQRPVTQLTRTLRQFTYRGMLGGNISSAMRNLSQGVNVYATLGEKYTALGYVKMFTPSAQRELAEQGVLANAFIEDRTLSTFKKGLQKADKALFVFFDGAERINRGAAYFGAKSKGLAKGMSDEEAIKYAKEIVRKTQFAYDAVDQPQIIASDLAKTLAQFMSYPIKQSEFLIELAKDKNYAGLIRYGIGGMAFVYTVGQAFGMEPKEIIPSFRFGVPPSLKLPAELVKAGLDSPNKYGGDRDLKTKLADIGKSAIGLIPGGIQAKKTIDGYKANQDEGVYTKAGARQFKTGETTLSKAQNLLFGKYSSEASKNYFNKVKTPEQELKAKKVAEGKEEKQKVRPLYDHVQTLVTEGKDAEAKAVVDAMTDEEYDSYVNIRTQERSENTETFRLKLELDPNDAVKYLRSLNKPEQERILNLMSEEEYVAYESGK